MALLSLILPVLLASAMSHNVSNVSAAQQDAVRDLMTAAAQPKRPRKRPIKIGARQDQTFSIKLEQGRTVYDFAKMQIGDEALNDMVQGKKGILFPRGFWPACTRHCFNRVCTAALRKSLMKSLRLYMQALKKGAKTACGELGEKRPQQKRSAGGTFNALKCPELGQLLYDWFIDCIQLYRARTDYSLFLHQAKYLRQRLLDQGYEPQNLPQLDGAAGKQWLLRWRRRFRIIARKTVKHLKVSKKKLKARVRVFLKNCFALRYLWLRCFGEARKMRWVSWDQKPAWFNNTALDSSYSTVGY